MTDTYSNLVNTNPVGKKIAGRLGLPRPAKLRRWEEGQDLLTGPAAVAGIGSVVYGRFFLRVSAAQGDSHTTFLAMKDNNDAGGKDLRMGGQSKILVWNRESDYATLPALSPVGISKSVALPPQKWTCIEFKVDGAAGGLQTWVDGAEIEGLLIDATPTPDVDQQSLSKPNWKPALVDFKLTSRALPS